MAADDGEDLAIWPTEIGQADEARLSLGPRHDAPTEAPEPDLGAPPFSSASPFPPIADYAFLSD